MRYQGGCQISRTSSGLNLEVRASTQQPIGRAHERASKERVVGRSGYGIVVDVENPLFVVEVITPDLVVRHHAAIGNVVSEWLHLQLRVVQQVDEITAHEHVIRVDVQAPLRKDETES